METLKDYMDKKAVARGAGADRGLPRAQGRESVPDPGLPHRRPRHRGLSAATCARPGGRLARRGQGRRPGHPPDRGRADQHRPRRHAGRAARADPTGPGRDAGDLRTRRRQDPPDPRGPRHRLPARARGGRDTTAAWPSCPGSATKTSENILKSIAFLRQASAYRLSHHAADEAEGLRAALAKLPGVTAALIAGDVRRRSEVVRDLVMVLVADVSPARAVQASQPASRACTSSPGRTSAGSRSASPAARARRSW